MSLAFDTYQRLNLIRRFLDHLLHSEANSPAWVLDVGGHPGYLAGSVGTGLRTVTLDLHESNLRDYVRGSGRQLPFGTGRFNATVASDVLEHVPPAERDDFLGELSRVSRGWVILGGPFRSLEVEQAEASVNEMTRLVNGSFNPWLDEHRHQGLPDLGETRRSLLELGFLSAVIPNGSLFSWFLLKEFEMLLHALPGGFARFDEINTLYLRLWAEVDHHRPTYRHLVLAHRRAERVEALIQSPPARSGLQFFGPGTEVPTCPDEVERIRGVAEQFEKLAGFLKSKLESGPKRLDAEYVKRLEQIIENQERQREVMERELEESRSRLKAYDSSRFMKLWRKLRWK